MPSSSVSLGVVDKNAVGHFIRALTKDVTNPAKLPLSYLNVDVGKISSGVQFSIADGIWPENV